MLVAEIMTTNVEFIAPEATVQEAAVLMGEIDSGALPVGTAGDLQGIVTDRDILFRAIAVGADPRQVRVREIMSSTVFACHEDDTIAAVMDMMASYHVRRLPVGDAAGRIVGWVTLSDVSCYLLVKSEVVIAALSDLSLGGEEAVAV
jgi:CBS domain-containing protein